MKQPSYSNFRIILGSVLITLTVVTGFWIVKQTAAYTGPTGVPGGSTTGAFRYDAANNAVSVGGSIPNPATTLLVSGGTAQPTDYGLVVENSISSPALQVRDDGKVFIGGFVSADPATLQSQSIFSNFANYDTLTTNQGNVYNFIDGQGTANILDFASIQGVTLSGNIGADYITSDVFGSQDVPGNYAFPAKLGVGTTTVLSSGLPEALTVQGGAYLTGNVGIGKTPAAKLDVLGTIKSTGLDTNGLTKTVTFQLTTLPSNSYVLTSDASGYGTWKPLPSLSGSSNQTLRHNGASWVGSSFLINTDTGVGIGKTPTSELDVLGTIKSTGLDTNGLTKTVTFQLTTLPSNGYVLTSDASGYGTWKPLPGLPGGSTNQTLRHNGASWIASSFLTNNDSSVGVGVTPVAGTYLQVGSLGYLQFDKSFSGAPLATDCNSDTERGRLTVDYTNKRLYVCTGVTNGWQFLKLQ